MRLQQSIQTTVLIAAILLAVWWVLSGKFDVLYFGTGVATAAVLAVLYHGVQDGTPFRPLRFLLFVPWLIGQIVISNVRVARLVLSRRMVFRPTFISQTPGVRGSRALTMLGSSMTLTPGTLTVDISREEFFIHALDAKSAHDAQEGLMAQHVGRVFPRRAP
jgi:multicomponent Na+:H+ antiporter subunit E